MYGTFLWFIFLFSFSYSEYSFVTQIVISGIRIVMHQSIPAAPSLTPPPPTPGLQRGICPPCQSRGWGVCKFCAARGRVFANPELLTRTRFPVRIQLHKGFYWKNKGISSFAKDRKQLKRFVKTCSRFYACMSSLLIKPELQGNGAIDGINGYWIKFLLSISRTSFHIFKTIHNS